MLHEEITGKVIASAFEVYRHLRFGYLEKVYEKALVHEMKLKGLNIGTQVPLTIKYKGEDVGNFIADLVVDNKVIIELKSNKGSVKDSIPQMLNYLKVTGMKVGLLINFGDKKVEYKRIML